MRAIYRPIDPGTAAPPLRQRSRRGRWLRASSETALAFLTIPNIKMIPTLELLLSRRSVPPRLLAAPAPTPDQLAVLLTIAARAPDHGRMVPWRFIIIGASGGVRIGDLIAAAFVADHPDASLDQISNERGRLTRAPLVIAVVSSTRDHPKAPEWEQMLSAGAATMSLIVAANAMGYASNWHTGWYAYDRRITDALGLAANERIAGFVHIGTPLEHPADRPRPTLADIVLTYGADGIGEYADARTPRS